MIRVLSGISGLNGEANAINIQSPTTRNDAGRVSDKLGIEGLLAGVRWFGSAVRVL